MPGAADPPVLHARLLDGQGGLRGSRLPQLHTPIVSGRRVVYKVIDGIFIEIAREIELKEPQPKKSKETKLYILLWLHVNSACEDGKIE